MAEGDIIIDPEVRNALDLDNDSELLAILQKAKPDLPVDNTREEIIAIDDLREQNPPRVYIKYSVHSGDDYIGEFPVTVILDKDKKIRHIEYE